MTEIPNTYRCRFYNGGECLFLRKHPVATPSLARVRRLHRESLFAVLEGGSILTGKRNYDCAARFSLDRGEFQRNCTITPLHLGARFGIINK